MSVNSSRNIERSLGYTYDTVRSNRVQKNIDLSKSLDREITALIELSNSPFHDDRILGHLIRSPSSQRMYKSSAIGDLRAWAVGSSALRG